MRTLIISDLHLGSGTRVDVLRTNRARTPLWEALGGADRLVLLGDVLELRHGPRAEALRAARPFFEELAGVFGGEIVIVPGNHDHALIAPYLERREESGAGEPLGLEQRFAPREASRTLADIAHLLAPAQLSVAYPGLWVREDLYATHGHYLDCHIVIPTLERLGLGATARLQRRPLGSLGGPEDYEALTGPIYAWIDAMARRASADTKPDPSTVRVWRALGGDRDHRPLRRRTALRNRVLAAGFPLAVAALNRAGLGPLRAEISGPALRRAGLVAMGEVIARIGAARAAHIVFGHTHRTGRLPSDAQSEWRAPGGSRLLNCGSWTYDPAFLDGQSSTHPYWPGGCVIVEDERSPRLERLLADRPHSELSPSASAD